MSITPVQAQAVLDGSLGLRSGLEPKHAAYGMNDIFGEGQGPPAIPKAVQIATWLQTPAAYDDRWRQRLENTVKYIQSLAAEGGTILVLTGASASAERYHVANGMRDGFTFAKCPRVQRDSATIATITFTERSSIADLCNSIENSIQ